MLDAIQARVDIVRPAIALIGMWSAAAEDLVLLTAADETKLGSFVRQKPGPALGWCQMEPETHTDCWENWIQARPDLARQISALVPPCHWKADSAMPSHEALIGNFLYSAAMARIKYRRAKPPLPAPGDWPRLAEYWDKHYNADGNRDVEHCLAMGRACGIIPRILTGGGGE